MISINKLAAALSLVLLSSIGLATTDQADIELQFTHTPYVSLTGTAPGSSRMYENTDIANWIFPTVVDIGTLGLDSNVPGDCDVSFSTLNNFDLLHTVSNASLTQYKLLYQSQEFGLANNPTLSIPCNTTPTMFQFKPTGIVFGNFSAASLIQNGVYRDVVTVVVTTQ
jgi:hypothetical protein